VIGTSFCCKLLRFTEPGKFSLPRTRLQRLPVPGSAGDGSQHLVERATTAQRTSSTGQQITEHQVQRPVPGDPGSSLQVTILTTDTVRPDGSGAQATRTVQASDANGHLGVIFVDITKADNIHTIQVRIAPSEKPK
jgi:hypothetical protein